jgi:hypothetical protein
MDIQATRKVFIPQKVTSSTSNLKISSLLLVIFAILDPDPDPTNQNGCGPMRIRIPSTASYLTHNVAPSYNKNRNKKLKLSIVQLTVITFAKKLEER